VHDSETQRFNNYLHDTSETQLVSETAELARPIQLCLRDICNRTFEAELLVAEEDALDGSCWCIFCNL